MEDHRKCERCGEQIKPNSNIPSERDCAEIEDKDGKVLVVHENCIAKTDKIA